MYIDLYPKNAGLFYIFKSAVVMTFKNLNKGYTIPMIYKKESNLDLKHGIVIEKSLPRMEVNNGLKPTSNSVIDLTLNVDGNTVTYVVPEESSIVTTNNGEYVIAVEDSYIIHELEIIQGNAKTILNSIDKYQTIYDKASKLLIELNPQLKTNQETKDRLDKMELAILDIQKGMSKLLEKV